MKASAFLPIVLLAVVVSSCKDAGTGPGSEPPSELYLETEYVNSAWGYSHNGRFIDAAGDIISYDLASSGTQWVTNSTGYYTEAELWAKIHHSDTVRGFVPADTLKMLRRLAFASVPGANSDTICAGADRGLFITCCYVFRADSSKFQRIELRVDGDCTYHNTSQSAIELANWLAGK
jgi:hypothetical protein